MPSTVTVTLPTGPGSSVTANVTANARKVEYDLIGKVLSVTDFDNKVKQFDFNSAATVTHTISGGNSTITVSS